MYASLLRKELTRLGSRAWQLASRSGALTIAVVVLIVAGLAVGWHEHRRGHFARLKAEIRGIPSQPHEQAGIRPGGQDVVVLQRSPLPGGGGPEFLSATLLPGLGMNVLQIRANLPDRGEVDLLAAPPLADAATMLRSPDVGATVGGAIEVPWAGRMAGYGPADGDTVTTVWRGHRLELPNAWKAREGAIGAMAVGGLLAALPSSELKTHVMPDGGVAQADFQAETFGGRWPSRTDVTTRVQLSGRAMEMTVVARNTGNEAEPMGIGWRPRFAIVGGDRQLVTLRLPNSARIDIPNRRTGVPSGKLLPVQDTPYDFTRPEGSPLGTLNLDDCFVHLRPGLLDNGPSVELRDPAGGYGLRITAVSSSIKAIRIDAPANANFVSIDPMMNYDDPFGREWPGSEDTGMATLQPGQSVQWKIRVEIFPLQGPENAKF